MHLIHNEIHDEALEVTGFRDLRGVKHQHHTHNIS